MHLSPSLDLKEMNKQKQIEFEIKHKTEDYIGLNQLLKVLHLVENGGMANEFISEGLVKVNGEIERRKRAKLRKGDVVMFEGKEILIS